MDIAESAVKGARLAHKGVEGLEFVLADLFDPELSQKKRYGAVWEHTCYCAIMPERRGDYVEAVANLLGKDGLLIGVFFLKEKLDLAKVFSTMMTLFGAALLRYAR